MKVPEFKTNVNSATKMIKNWNFLRTEKAFKEYMNCNNIIINNMTRE